MTAKVWSGSAALACAAWVAILGFASTAYALDAYWGGRRSNNWNVGREPGGQASNWYRDPLYQIPVGVPDGTAIFAGTAGRDVPPVISGIAEIGRIRLESGASPIEIGIERASGRLVISGTGIANQSAVTPRFNVNGDMWFKNSARLQSVGARSAAFSVGDGGTLRFKDSSKGGDAMVETLHSTSWVTFHQDASAQNMVINSIFGIVDFRERSTGANATFINRQNGQLFFDLSRGPAGDGLVPAGRIQNEGDLIIGLTNLVVRHDFDLAFAFRGAVYFDVATPVRAGSVVVNGKTRLAGDLVVRARPGMGVGQHLLVKAKGGMTGRFDRVLYQRFPPDLRGRIAYSSREVKLIVEPR